MKLSVAFSSLTLALFVCPLGAQDVDWSGCYTMKREAWSWSRQDEDSTQFVPPRVFELLRSTEAGAGWAEARPAMMSYRTARGRWRGEGIDSLLVIWSNGFTGVWIRAAAVGDSLTGTATAWTDNGGDISSVRITLRRTSCDSLGVGRSYQFEAEPAPDDDREVWLGFHSESVRIVVEGTHWGLDARVAVGRAAPAAFENYDLEDLMALRGAGWLPRPRRGSLKIGTTQLQQVEFYAGALREIGDDILRGDLRSFPDLEARVEERHRAFSRDRSRNWTDAAIRFSDAWCPEHAHHSA